ncbi:hypothetical protein [Tepidibacillus marianensis]
MSNPIHQQYPIITPNVQLAKYQLLKNGAKRFHLIAQPIVQALVAG